MKSVIISIKPRWCSLISSGRKTIEVRKTKPRIKPPFKCYVYCTRPHTKNPHEILEIHSPEGKIFRANGKVIGEFVCDKVTNLFADSRLWLNEDYVTQSCLTADDIRKYAGGAERIYGWHISDIVIYDNPRDISELRAICRHYDDGHCGGCKYYDYANNESYHYEECAVDGLKPIARPPQSWCYTEEPQNSSGED